MGERKHSAPELDDVFLALSHPTRRRLLELLQEQPRGVTDLAASFDLSLNVVSKHLKYLERARLVRRTREGKIHRLECEPEPLQNAARWMSHHLAFWTANLDAFAAFLARNPPDSPPPAAPPATTAPASPSSSQQP